MEMFYLKDQIMAPYSGIDLYLKLTQVLRGKLTHLSGGGVSK